MKKRVLSVVLALIILAIPLSMPAHAFTNNSFTVSTTVNTTLNFTKEMFLYRTTTPTLSKVKITALPTPTALGDLMLNDIAVVLNQEISLANLDRLTFVPKKDQIGDAVFEYEAYDSAGTAADAPAEVTVKITELFPVAKDLVFTTSRNTPVYGMFEATDARGRTLTYDIVSAPPAGNTVEPNPHFPSFVFTPQTDEIGLVTFTYEAVAGTAHSEPATVSIYIGGRPTAYDQDVTVEKNTIFKGKMTANDPEKRAMTFIVNTEDKPKNGSFTITNASTGEFTYTPNRDFEGDDSFKFHVTVSSGSIQSNVATVKIKVAKYAITPVVYDDMANHWGATSAGSLAALGIVRGETIGFSTTGSATGTLDERTFFKPDEPLTRGDFILWLVSAMHIRPDTSTATVFYDTVPYWLVGPSNAAYHENIVEGTLVNGRRLLKAGGNLTRLEAVVMIDRAMKLSTNDKTPTFVDWHTVPGWGQQAVRNLAGYEILKGNDAGFLHPHDMLTRAEAAELLFKSYKEAVLEKR